MPLDCLTGLSSGKEIVRKGKWLPVSHEGEKGKRKRAYFQLLRGWSGMVQDREGGMLA